MSDTTWAKVTKEIPCTECGTHVKGCTRTPDGTRGHCHKTGENWHRPNSNGNGNGYVGAAHRPKATRKSKAKSYATREDAINSIVCRLRGEHPDASFTAASDYHYRGGAVAMTVLRFDWVEDKSYRPIHPVDGGWCEGDPDGSLPLFRLNELSTTGIVVVTEGEKACLAAVSNGLNATTSAHGSASASKTDWSPIANAKLILLLPDADEPGAKYVRAVAKILFKINPSARIKIVELPGLPDGGDIVEFIEAGGRADEIDALQAATPFVEASDIIGGPIVTCLADVESKPVEWLWPGRIASGCITMFVGLPGVGKSFVTSAIGAAITTGSPWPDGSGRAPLGSVLFIAYEDDPAYTIRPRCDACYADARKIHLLTMVKRVDDEGVLHEQIFILGNVADLESTLKRIPDIKLVVIDPIGSAIGGSTDSHRDNEVRGVLAPVAALMAKYGVAGLIVAHRRKSIGQIADDMAMGSRAFTGIARGVWHLSKDPQNPSRRLMLSGKCNLAKEGTGLAFSIVGDGQQATVAWERDAVDMSADEALHNEQDAPEKPGPDPVKRDAAEEWLRDLLADGELAVAKIQESAKASGLSWNGAVRRAREAIGIKPYKGQFGDGWYWKLPPDPLDDGNLSDIPFLDGKNEDAHQGAQPHLREKTCAPSMQPAHVGDFDHENDVDETVREGVSDTPRASSTEPSKDNDLQQYHSEDEQDAHFLGAEEVAL